MSQAPSAGSLNLGKTVDGGPALPPASTPSSAGAASRSHPLSTLIPGYLPGIRLIWSWCSPTRHPQARPGTMRTACWLRPSPPAWSLSGKPDADLLMSTWSNTVTTTDGLVGPLSAHSSEHCFTKRLRPLYWPLLKNRSHLRRRTTAMAERRPSEKLREACLDAEEIDRLLNLS